MILAGVLFLLEAGEDNQHAAGSFGGVAPAVVQAGGEQQTVARLKDEALTFNFVLQVPLDQQDELVPRMEQAVRSAGGAWLQVKYKRLNAPEEGFATQPFPAPTWKLNSRMLISFAKDDRLAGQLEAEEGSDGDFQGFR